MNILKILQKCLPSSAVTNQSVTREISVSAYRSNIRWRLANGYPAHWSNRGTLTDAPDFSYTDGRPTPYSSGQRARLLVQKEYAERIIYLLNGIKFVKEKRMYRKKQKKAEAINTLTQKLKWKGVKETNISEMEHPNPKKSNRKSTN